MTNTPEKRFFFPKLVAVMAVGVLMGAGLCGLDFALAAHGIGKSTEEFGVGPLDGVSLAVMALSALGLLFSLAAWVLATIFKSREPAGGNNELPQVPDDRDQTKHDGR
ncbi:MAG: hypothetical protein ABSE51_14940 [Terracidiphilus sp.]|jgi:hypothetical protein